MMQLNRWVVCVILFISILSCASAQTQDINTPSTQRIDSLSRVKKKTKLGKYFQKTVFKRQPSRSNTKIQAVEKSELDDNFKKFQGKIIRNINIQSYDPFGYSLTDTTKAPKKKLEQLGNKLHLKTKSFTVRSLLLVKPNQPLDSIRVKESERLIRNQRYIRRVRIKPIEIAGTDSVDLDVRVLDAWSIYPNGSLSTSSARLNLSTRNFGGLGHFVSGYYRTKFTTGEDAVRGQYFIPNIAQTFISTNLYYEKDLADNYVKTIAVNRNFYSPLTKWAGGISYNQTFYRDSVPNVLKETFDISNFKYNYTNIWGGYSMRLYEKYKNQRIITNLITSVRFFNVNYSEQPTQLYDPYSFYSDNKTVLASTSISSFNYVKDQYIFYDNIIEDIAVGKNLGITTGIQWKNNIRRPYLGAHLSFGDYFKTGYFGGSIQWGTFFNGKELEQSVFRLEGMYFSKVFQLGNWKFRQFFNPELVIGYNRIDYEKDRISLNGRYGIEGFDSYHLRGTKKLLLNFQTQSYAPKQWLGFRFNPFLNMSLGMIGDTDHFIFEKQIYARFGLGVQINNDYLIFNRFQLSVSYFPNIPGNGHNVIRTNNLKNNQFQLQQFNVGQPEIVPYQ